MQGGGYNITHIYGYGVSRGYSGKLGVEVLLVLRLGWCLVSLSGVTGVGAHVASGVNAEVNIPFTAQGLDKAGVHSSHLSALWRAY